MTWQDMDYDLTLACEWPSWHGEEVPLATFWFRSSYDGQVYAICNTCAARLVGSPNVLERIGPGRAEQ